MNTPKGKRNLQTYIKTLSAKQNFIDREARVAQERRKKAAGYELAQGFDSDDDPRGLADLAEEHNDLQEQYLHQMANLESYLAVASMWMEELATERQYEGISQNNDSFEGIDGSQGDDDFYTAEGFEQTVEKKELEPAEAISVAQTRDKTTERGPSVRSPPAKTSNFDEMSYENFPDAKSVAKAVSEAPAGFNRSPGRTPRATQSQAALP